MNSVYKQAKNANTANENRFKVKGNTEHNLNTAVLVGDLDYAIQFLNSAIDRLDDEAVLEHEHVQREDIEHLLRELRSLKTDITEVRGESPVL